MSPCARSLAKLRKEGWYAEVVEHYNAFSRKRHDLFGFADIIVLREFEPLLVQTTTRSNLSARVKKIKASPLYQQVSRNFVIAAHGWYKKGNRWYCKVVDLS